MAVPTDSSQPLLKLNPFQLARTIDTIVQSKNHRCNQTFLWQYSTRNLHQTLSHIVFSDSMLSLQAITDNKSDQHVARNIILLYSSLINNNNIIFCLITGHSGIKGNIEADKVVKSAVTLAITPVLLSASDFSPRVKR